MKKLYLAAILIAIVACSVLAVPLLINSAAEASKSPIEKEIDKAIQFMAKSNEPHAILLNNVLYRQFGVTQFSDSLQKYDQLTAGKSDPTLKLFRRMAAYDNSVDSSAFGAVQEDVDKITVPALYADRRALPANYSAMLQAGLEGGEYLTTHTLLAVLWLKENNCTVALPVNFMNSLYQATAALIDNGTELTDLKIEAAALLYQAGQGQLVSSSFTDLVMANQNSDGGWPPTSNFNPKDSYWHTTALALMLLLNLDHPSSTYRSWLVTAQTSQTQSSPSALAILPLTFVIRARV
jgi:hypothetical protein